MDSQTTSGNPTSSDTRRRWWWSRPIVTLDHEQTFKEFAVFISPFFAGFFIAVAIYLIFLFIDKAHSQSHPKFSIQSITVSPYSTTCHVDFLVKKPSSRYSIYYDVGDASVRFGHTNVDVFNITRKRNSRDHTAFSLDFVAGEVNGTDVVSQELHIKLRGNHKRYVDSTEAGHFDLFAHSVSVTNTNVNANISTADWRVGLVAMSPVTGCKISFHTIKSRLLRGEEVVSETSPSVDGFGQVVTSDKTDGPVISVDFKGVVTPGIIGDVVRGYRVEVVAGVDSDGFLMVLCGDLPLKFTADPAGNVIGSLLGNMKRCDYVFEDNLNIHV
ncbi:uncharacterized protein LOC103845568 [Brassica rapa]|uniref:uncharacterized protein LOC103845568 n=1 Tax=Brassica campestris TaxID=3711 RepID=UPI00142E06F4|nr:uncharacterized protein LOC103845568 [Brassica rapa]